MAIKNQYTLFVGNIGQIYSGTNQKEAISQFVDARQTSKEGMGRGGNEPVTLFKNGEPFREYIPKGVQMRRDK